MKADPTHKALAKGANVREHPMPAALDRRDLILIMSDNKV
jgi:hypothetical protein